MPPAHEGAEPVLAAEAIGIDLTQPLTDRDVAAVNTGMNQYAMLVFRNQLADGDADSDDARTRRPLQAAACTYRIAFGPRAGQKVLKLKTAWRDGTTHLVMSPPEFMQRLAALVPRPCRHPRPHGIRG